MNNKIFAVILLVALVTGVMVAWAASTYKWWSGERIITGGETTAVVAWSGAGEVGQLETITVSITNTKATTSTGMLNIKIYDGPTESDNVIIDLTPDQAVSVPSGMTVDYTKTWTPNIADSYYALATYTED